MDTYVCIGICIYRVPYDECNNCVSDTQVYCTATAVKATFKPSLSFVITTLPIAIQLKAFSLLGRKSCTYLINVHAVQLPAAVWAYNCYDKLITLLLFMGYLCLSGYLNSGYGC